MQLQVPVSPAAAVKAKPRGLSLLSHLILYALLISIPMLGFGAWMINHYSRAEREATEQKARWYARDLSKSIEHELRRVADQLNTLASSRSLLSGDLENLYRRAAHAASIFKGSMIVRDAGGQQLFNTHVPWGTELPISAIPKEARQDLAAGRIHISDLYVGAVKKRPILSVSIPLMEDGRLTHSISMSLEPDALLTGLGIPLPPDGWNASVADRLGITIASTHDHAAAMGRPAVPIPAKTETSSGNSREWGDDDITMSGGQRALRAYHRSQLSGWTTAVTIPVGRLEAPFALRWQALAAAGGMLLALSTLLAFILAKDLVHQFQLVAGQASALIMGNRLQAQRSSMREVNDVLQSLTTASRNNSVRDRALRESEAQLRAVFEGSPIGMFRADLDKNCTYANPQLCKLANTSMEHMIGRNWLETVPAGAREDLDQAWDEAIRLRGPLDLEMKVTSIKRGLGAIYTHIHAVPEFDADGKMIGYIGAVSNITRRKNAEATAAAQMDRFKRMLMATPDMVYLHEVGSPEIGLLNRNLVEILGIPRRDGKDLNYAELAAMIVPEDRENVQRHRNAMMHARDGEVHQVELRLRIPDPPSPPACVLIRTVVFARREDGSVLQTLGVVTDITARKAAEAQVAAEIEKFKRMTLASPDLIYLYDRQAHKITDLNRSLREVLGYPPGDPAKRGAGDMYEFMFPQDIDGAHAHVRALRNARDREVLTQESRFAGPDGGTRWMQNRSVVFSRHADGRVHLVLGVATDTTERNLAIEALARSHAELEAQVAVEVGRREQAQRELARAQNLEAIGRLTGGVAHDFNNILTVVMGSLRLFKRRHADTAPLSLIEDALGSAEIGRRLIQQLLSFARRRRLAPVPIDLGEHLGGVVRWIKTTLHESIEVRTNFAPGLGLIMVDEAGLDNAVINLIMNAHDAMGDSGVLFVETGNIQLAAAAGDSSPGDFVFLAISDTGSGIDPQIAERIFEPFFTTKAALAKENASGAGHGSGLGLSSVYGFITQSNGRIEMRSAPGQGACFILYFPQIAGTDLRPATPPADVEDVMACEGGTVLVVEDMANVRKLMVDTLESMGYRTLQAENGLVAQEILAAALAGGTPRIDAVLSDVVMPAGVSGLDLAHWIEDHAPEIAIVLMSGYDDGQQSATEQPLSSNRRPITRIGKPPSPLQISGALREARATCAQWRRAREAASRTTALVPAK